jgi:hypothetical protein
LIQRHRDLGDVTTRDIRSALRKIGADLPIFCMAAGLNRRRKPIAFAPYSVEIHGLKSVFERSGNGSHEENAINQKAESFTFSTKW